jgi:NAD+ kinase
LLIQIMKTNHEFTRIGLMARLKQPEVVETVRRLAEFLSGGRYQVLVEQETADQLPDNKINACDFELFATNIDLAIVVGGDGSMLRAARDLADYDVPILGVNRGRLGFLTDILPEEIEQRVCSVLAGEYVESNRFLLQTTISRNDQIIGTGSALNDVVLHPGQSVRMMEFELYIGGKFVNSQRSDGLIVATPTGSTAYALSGGGPILDPALDAIVVVPMNPHTLSSRPIVVHGNNDIVIRVGSRNELFPYVTCDGQNHVETEPGDVIDISKRPGEIRFIHPADHNFYQICRTKLGWGSRLDSLAHTSER